MRRVRLDISISEESKTDAVKERNVLKNKAYLKIV